MSAPGPGDVLGRLSDRRAETVAGIPLEDAVGALVGPAVRVELPHANEVLRLLHELHRRRPFGAPAAELPEVLHVVQSAGPNWQRNRLHVWDPATSSPRRTFCGKRCGGWRPAGELSVERLTSFGEWDRACRHCSQFIQRAASGDGPR